MRGLTRAVRRGPGVDHGIWSPFRSLLLAQVMSAILGLVFWILVARLVDPHEVGVAAAAISAQTLLGLVTVLGFSTMLISELPRQQATRQRAMVLRAMLVVLVASLVVGAVLVGVHSWLSTNLREALGDPVGASTFVVGIVAFAWALLIDDSCLALKRSNLQVGRNLFASGLRFPVTLALLALGFTDAHVLQICWVLPLVLSIPFTLWRLRLRRGPSDSPPLRRDIAGLLRLALRNHWLNLALAAGSQTIPVIAGLTLLAVDNAEFAIAWQMATFVFLPPYLLATALFAHGANVSTAEFRASMARTIPAALSLSALLCVGAWVLGEPVLLVFGGNYAEHSWEILALLVPAGLWMVCKDHLVALWRSQRRYGLATRLAGSALVIEIVGAAVGGIVAGARGLCIGWLIAMAVEIVLAVPYLRRSFGGLQWQSPFPWRHHADHADHADHAAAPAAPGVAVEAEPEAVVPATARKRREAGSIVPQVIVAAVVVVAMIGVGIWTATGGQGDGDPASSGDGSAEDGAPVKTCTPTAAHPGPDIDLNVQSATGRAGTPIKSSARIRRLVALADQAGADVISTTSSFRTMQPRPGDPIDFRFVDRTIAAARAAGDQVRLQLVGMPVWALDDPQHARQAPRSEAELARWSAFVTAVLQHVAGKVDYLEVWNEPNAYKWWPTGPSPVEFARLLATTYTAVKTVAPDVQVVSGGLAGNDIGFLKRTYTAFDTLGVTRTPFDLLGAHPFSGDAAPDSVDPGKRYEREPFGTYDENFVGFTGLHQVMAEHGDSSLRVYVTQFGYSTTGRDAVPDQERATYLTQALEQATCVPYVPVFSWYALQPTPWDPASYALLDERDRPNQTYDALATWGQRVAEATGRTTGATSAD